MKNGLKLVAFITLCLGLGSLGGIITAQAIPTWYAGLQRPAFSPPNWVFAPVWTTLYILMAIAAWRISNTQHDCRKKLLGLFFLQLALNVIWTPLFFGLHQPFWAFIDILALWLVLVATVRGFWVVDKTAGLLLLPYLLWVSFASYLNWGFWQLN